MEQAEKPDTFVFAPFMLEQIDTIKNESLKLAMFRALCQYGCYGQYEPIEQDPTGITEAMLLGMFKAIDRAKKNRATNRENGKKGGAPVGNKNAQKQNNRNSTENNRNSTNNVLMNKCNNDLMNEKEEKNDLSSLTATLSPQSGDPQTTSPPVLRERKNLSVGEFNKFWLQLPKEVQLSRQSRSESSTQNRDKRIKKWLNLFSEGKDYLTAKTQLLEIMKSYADHWQTSKPHNKSHMDYFMEISENIFNYINHQPQ